MLRLESFGVEDGRLESEKWEGCTGWWSSESEEEYPIPVPVGRCKLRGKVSLVRGGVSGMSSTDSIFELCDGKEHIDVMEIQVHAITYVVCVNLV